MRAHEVGDRIVYRIDPETVGYAIVVVKYRWQILMARRMQNEIDETGAGDILYLSEFEVLGFVDQPRMPRPQAGDLMVVETPHGMRFNLVISVTRHHTLATRFINSRKTFSRTPNNINRSLPYCIVGMSNIEIDLNEFYDLAKGHQRFKGFLQSPPPVQPAAIPFPGVSVDPDDPRHFRIEEVGVAVSVLNKGIVTVARLQYSTPYLDKFLYYLETVRSGARYAEGYQTMLAYCGPPDSRVPGSETGEVRAYFFNGLPADEHFRPLETAKSQQSLPAPAMVWPHRVFGRRTV